MIESQYRNLLFIGGSRDADYTIERDGLRGWFDQPDVRGDYTDIPYQHGEFDFPSFFGARVIEQSGQIHASGAFDYEAKVRALGQLNSRMGVSPFVVSSAQGPLRALAKPFEKPSITPLVYGEVAEYQLFLRCPDPRIYGAETRSGDGEPALNRGNFEATPVVYVTRQAGAAAGYTVTAGSGQITVTAELAVGQTHRIEVGRGRVFSGSTRLQRAVSTFRPWTVPAASTLVHSVSAGCALDVRTTDTFM